MNRNRALALAHISVFFMGITGVLSVVSGFNAWQTTSYRVVFGAVVLMGYLAFRRSIKPPAPGKIALLLGLGLLLGVHWFAFFRSIQLLGVILGSAMFGFSPIAIALIARLILGERMSRATLVAMVICTLGFIILGSDGIGESSDIVWGLFWSVFSFLTFALLVVVNRATVKTEAPLWVTTLEMLGAIPLAVWMTPGQWLPQNGEAWIYALMLGLFCTGLAYAMYNTSMKILSAPVAGLLLSLDVVYGISGGLIIGDTISARQALGSLLISNIIFIDLWRWLKSRKQ